MFLDIINSVGRAVAAPAMETRNPSALPWGVDLFEQSLSTLWRPRPWSDLADDELVLFIPSIENENEGKRGLAERIRSAGLSRIRVSLLLLGGEPSQTLRKLTEDCKLECTFPKNELQEIIDRNATHDELQLARRLQSTGLSDRLDEEIIISSLGRTLRTDENALPSLNDALIAAIHTACNSAYICPSYTYAHELLATGAWLGIMLKGRPALMPEFMAQVLHDYLKPSRGDELSAQILHCHIMPLGGVAYLSQVAHRVLRSGHAEVVHPKPPIASVRLPAHVP